MNHKTVPANAPMKSKNMPNLGMIIAIKPQQNTTRVLVTKNLITGKDSMVGKLFIAPETLDHVQSREHL